MQVLMIMAVNVCLILFFNIFKDGKIINLRRGAKKPSCEKCGCNFLTTTKWPKNSEPVPFWCIVSVLPSLILVFATVYRALSVQPQSQPSWTFLLSRFVLFSPFLGSKQKQQKAVFSQLFTTFPFPTKPFLSPAAAKRCPRPSGCSSNQSACN